MRIAVLVALLACCSCGRDTSVTVPSNATNEAPSQGPIVGEEGGQAGSDDGGGAHQLNPRN